MSGTGTPSGSAVGSIPTVSVLCLITTMWPAELLMGPALHRPPMVTEVRVLEKGCPWPPTPGVGACGPSPACVCGCVWLCVPLASCGLPQKVELLSCGALLLCRQ